MLYLIKHQFFIYACIANKNRLSKTCVAIHSQKTVLGKFTFYMNKVQFTNFKMN